MAPTLVLIRHAQALHNVDNNIHDPDLSELGQTQCVELRSNLQTTLKDLDVGLILVSPMRRTIQTALRSLDFLIDRGVPIRAHAGWQENSAKPCDTGSPLAALRAEFPTVDFSQVDPVYPDKTSPAGAAYAYNRGAIVGRARTCLAELRGREEKAVVVVSHSGFLRQGMTGWWFFNADYRIFDFEDEAGERSGLRQWESTRKGGMGKSWEERVVIGEDIPEEDEKLPVTGSGPLDA